MFDEQFIIYSERIAIRHIFTHNAFNGVRMFVNKYFYGRQRTNINHAAFEHGSLIACSNSHMFNRSLYHFSLYCNSVVLFILMNELSGFFCVNLNQKSFHHFVALYFSKCYFPIILKELLENAHVFLPEMRSNDLFVKNCVGQKSSSVNVNK